MDHTHFSHRWRPTARGFVALTLVTLAVLVLRGGESSGYHWLNYDVANCLYIGKKVLEGDLLYVDWYFFVTPPIVYLSAAAAFLAELTGLAPHSTIHLLVVLTGLLGLLVIRRSFPEDDAKATVTAFAYLGILVHAGVSASDFAQREHFFTLLFVPYLLWRLSEARPSPRVYLLLVCLGYIAMNKPHFVLSVVVAEAFFLRVGAYHLRIWGAMIAGASLPFVVLALQSPSAFAAFFTEAVSYHMSAAYEPYRTPFANFFMKDLSFAMIALGGGFLVTGTYGYFKKVVGGRSLVASFFVALACYLLFLQQHMFWAYHAIPFVGITYVMGAHFAWCGSGTIRSQLLRTVAASIIVVLPLLLVGKGIYTLARIMTEEAPITLRSLEPLLRDEELVMLVTPSVEGFVFSHALSHGIDVMGPWSSNYTVPPMLYVEDATRREKLVRDYFEPLFARAREERPALILFSTTTQGMPAGVTMHDVVEQYDLFPTPEYRRLEGPRNGWIVYEYTTGGR